MLTPFRLAAFTLVELITVIMILGIVSLGVSSFIGRGAEIYVDVTEREQIIGDSRFVIERLNRELRAALPNSLRLAGSGTTRHCIEFVPVAWSSFYTDLPVPPDAATKNIEVVELTGEQGEQYNTEGSDEVVVFPTNLSHVYDTSQNRRHELDTVSGITNNLVTLTLENDVTFAADSTASRLYIVRRPVSYCATSTGRLTRHANYGFLPIQSVDVSNIGNGVLMAEGLDNTLSNLGNPSASRLDDPFRITEATLVRNAFVHIRLIFARDGERLQFNNEVQIANAP